MKAWREYRIITVHRGRQQVMPQTAGVPPITDRAAAEEHLHHVLNAGIVTDAFLVEAEFWQSHWESLDQRHVYQPVDDTGTPLKPLRDVA